MKIQVYMHAVTIHPGVYVPRWQSEPLARAAAAALPPGGTGVDLCTGSGAIAAVLRDHDPKARIVATMCRFVPLRGGEGWQ